MKKGHLHHRPTQARLEGLEATRTREQDADLLAVMRTPHGRRFVLRVVEEIAGVMSDTFTGSSETFWREGKRSVGITVMQEAQRVAPQEFLGALNESYAARREETFKTNAAMEAAQESDE